VENRQQKAGAMMQKNRQRKSGASLVRGFFRILIGISIALTSLVAALYLFLLALAILLRVKWVSDKTPRLSKPWNRITQKIAGTRLGSLYFNLSALKHIGRSSGREYVTPLWAYPLGDGFVFALAYGPTVDWCRNIMASGKGTLTWKEQEYALEKPELLPITSAWQAYPLSARLFMRARGMKQCLWMHKQSVVPQ
jgi:hypothetical protein